MSAAAETAARMVESLPPDAQERVVDQLRELVAEAAEDARWDEVIERRRDALQRAAREARAAIARGESTPMDFGAL